MDILNPVILATPNSPFLISDHHLISSDVSESAYTEFSNTASVVAGDQRQVTSKSSTVTLTIASPCVVSWTNHLLVADTPVTLSTTGSLPTGLSANTVYYVVDAKEDSFSLAKKPGGTAINTSGSQSGTHTLSATVHGVYEALIDSASATSSTISGTTLTISGTVTGEFRVGMILNSTGIGFVAGTRIVSFITGTGGTGTYEVSVSYGSFGTDPMTGHAPYTDTGAWLRIGATNRWRMHDYSTNKQTANLNAITNSYTFSQVVDTVAFLNVDAKTIRVKVTDNTGPTTVYDTTKTTESASTITGETERFQNVIFDDLPSAYDDIDIDVTLSGNSGETVLCGWCVFGKRMVFGITESGSKLGFRDFSVKNRDDFGNFSITERGFSKSLDFVGLIENSDIDLVYKILSTLKTKPVVYIATTTLSATAVLGFFTDFDIEIPYPDHSLISIEVEGVTQ